MEEVLGAARAAGSRDARADARAASISRPTLARARAQVRVEREALGDRGDALGQLAAARVERRASARWR